MNTSSSDSYGIRDFKTLEWKFLGYFILSRAWFVANFWAIFLLNKGFDLAEIAALDIVFWGVVLLLEVPTGVVADKFGRKLSVFVAYIVISLGMIIFAFANDFPQLILSYIIWGIGMTLFSGAEEAWVYDEMKYTYSGDIDQQYHKTYGIYLGVGLLSNAFAGIIAGLIAEVSLQLVMVANAVAFFGAAIWSLTIPEHYNQAELITKSESQLKKGMRTLLSPSVINIAIKSTIILGFTLTVIFWAQPYLNVAAIDYWMIGIILSLGTIMISIGSMYSNKITSILGRFSEIILILATAGLLILMGMTPIILSISFYFLFSISRGIWGPYLSTILNESLESSTRATVISIVSAFRRLVISLVEIISALFIVSIGGVSGYLQFFIWSGVVMFALFALISAIQIFIGLQKKESGHPSM